MLFEHFDWNLLHQVLLLYILPSHHISLRDQPWRFTLLWYRTDICSWYLLYLTIHSQLHFFVNWTISAFVSSRLARRSPANSLFPSGKAMFFWSHPRCFGPLGKFQHNIKISIKTARVSRLSFSCDNVMNKLLRKPVLVRKSSFHLFWHWFLTLPFVLS